MPGSSRVDGIDRTIAMVERLAPAAREELEETIRTIAEAVQEQQVALAPQRTGKVRSEISWQAVAGKLLAKVGLLGKTNGPGFYGRFVNWGRHAQTVLVQRRRRVNGALRTLRRRKRTEDIVATYTLHVKARVARPFVVIAPQMQQSADTALADFWTRALGRVEA